MLMKGEKLACGLVGFFSSDCPYIYTFTLLMTVDLKQWRLESFSLAVFKK